MELQQALKMIEWLDEERRRDKTTIAKLEERMQHQQDLIEQLNRQFNGLESQQVSMRTQFLPANRDSEIMEQLRTEMRLMLEEIDGKRATTEREVDRRADFAREMMARPLRELTERLDKIERQFDAFNNARAERDRMSGSLTSVQQRLDDLGKKLDEPERRLAFLEEQRRQESRRLADMQSEFPEIQKAIDGIKVKIERVEQLALSNEKRILETQAGDRTRREELQVFIDHQNLLSQQRDQQVKELTRNVTAYDEDMRRNMERFEGWSETHRQMKKVLDDFERMTDRLERRINEVSEMQRLSETRFREEWDEWKKEDQRQFKQFTLTNDEAWRNHEQEMVARRKSLEEMRDEIAPVKKSLARLWELEEARARLYLEGYQNLMLKYEVVAPKPSLLQSTTNGDTAEK